MPCFYPWKDLKMLEKLTKTSSVKCPTTQTKVINKYLLFINYFFKDSWLNLLLSYYLPNNSRKFHLGFYMKIGSDWGNSFVKMMTQEGVKNIDTEIFSKIENSIKNGEVDEDFTFIKLHIETRVFYQYQFDFMTVNHLNLDTMKYESINK